MRFKRRRLNAGCGFWNFREQKFQEKKILTLINKIFLLILVIASAEYPQEILEEE